MAKVNTKVEQKVDYKDSSLHQDFAEIKVLLSILIRDLDTVTKLMTDVHEVEMIKAGRL